MDCAEEVSLLRNQLGPKPGVRDLQFDIFQAKMSVEFDEALIHQADIEQAVHAVGMRAEPWQAQPKTQTYWERNRRKFATSFSGACLLLGMAFQSLVTGNYLQTLLAHQHSHHVQLPWFVIALYSAATLSGALFALPKAAASIRQARPDMNALVVFSVLGASVLGEWSEAATLSFLFALAGLLESWSLAKARDAISKLLQVAPPVATVVHYHGHDDHHGEHEHRTPVESVNVGAIVRVKPGERLPFDGKVVRGSSLVDQALITGESVPAEKVAGDSVWAGTINQDGMIEVKTTSAAADTVLARMVRMVEQSQSRRAPSEQFVERFSRIYTPLVFLLAFFVAVLPPLSGHGPWSDWFYQGMVILLISCPCALIISTPVSIVAALTSAARQGVLIKGGTYLEEAAKLRAFAFDKTGVLTQGVPEVQTLEPVNGLRREDVLRNLAGLEMSSEHPLGKAILRYASGQGIKPPALMGFRAIQGRGAEALVDDQPFWVGSVRMLRERNLYTPGIEAHLDRLTDDQHTVVACGSDDQAWALLAIQDPPRPEARAALAGLRAEGIERLVMLTGDNASTARSVSRAVGVDEVRAELLPEDKASAIRELRLNYTHVAMVGDGVNDAQALAGASVGIGVGRQGSDVAMETADIVLMSGDLHQLPFLLRHSKRTVRVIQENITLALALKAIFLAAAFAGLATLWMAVAADMGATFLVTFNGLRLLRAKS
jgi:Zn2+/Cd2+-exporting ATPase